MRSVVALGDGNLAAVVDPTEAGRETARTLTADLPAGSVLVTDDLQAILDDETIRGVMIATPAETHFSIARRCLDAGKECFVEKPLTVDLDEARQLVDHAAGLGRTLMVGHLLEYHPAILKLHELIASGELGSVRYIASNRLNLGKVRTEENALWSFAPHDIAVILRLVGASPVQVVATGGCYVTPNIADTTITQLLFANGVRSHVYVSWLHPFKEQKLVVVGSKKMASFDDISKELVLYDQRVEWQEGHPIPHRGDGTVVAYPADEPLKAECRHFIEAVEGKHAPLTDGCNGLRVLQVLHAAQRSMVCNGSPVDVDVDRPTPVADGPTIETMPISGVVPSMAAAATTNGAGR